MHSTHSRARNVTSSPGSGRRKQRKKNLWELEEISVEQFAEMMAYQKRLKKEYEELSMRAPTGISLDQDTTEDNIDIWKIHVEGPQSTLYEGERFILQFKFNSKYPFDSPQVTFIGEHVPIHPHIYSNGHICLSILDKDWSPAMNVTSVCLSIQSMLSTCTKKVRPPDDTVYLRFATKNPKKTRWVFHDDKV